MRISQLDGRRGTKGQLVAGVFAACVVIGGMNAPGQAALLSVDVDSTRVSGTDTSGTLTTQAGFTSWDLTDVVDGVSNITLDGVTFTVFSLDANAFDSRIRDGGAGGDGGTFNDVATDFVFADSSTATLGLRIEGLPVGTHDVQSWHFDNIGAGTDTHSVDVSVRNQGDPSSTLLLDDQPWSADPLSYQIEVTAPGQVKELLFTPGSVGTNVSRTRLNGFTVDVVPEPASVMLVCIGGAVVLGGGLVRRRARRA